MNLIANDARLTLAGKYAAKHGLDPAIVCAVIEQESAWNPYAVRFEPAFEARYIKPAMPSTPTTFEITRAMSFGLMQIMGDVALEFNWTGRFLTELCDPDMGVEYGCRKLRACFDAHPGSPEAALLAYNGGGNLVYGKQVLGRVWKYQPKPEPQGAD